MPFWVEPELDAARARGPEGWLAAIGRWRPWRGGRWLALVALALLVAAGGLYACAPRLLSGVAGGGKRSVPAGKFVFVHVYEASTHASPAALRAPAPERVGWNERTRRMTVEFAEDRPRAATQVYVVAEQHAALRRLASQAYLVGAAPYKLPVEKPVVGVENRQRLVPGPVEIAAIETDGSLRFRFDGREFTLRPGQEARFGWYRDAAGAVRAFEGGPDWQATIDRAVARQWPLTNLIIANLGLWDLAAVSP